MIEARPGGILLVDKPSGPTSHDVVARARRELDERKVGHTGTLDPFASGLLVLCIGAATRLAEYLSDLDKTYDAAARFGERTDTLDPEGEVVERDDSWRDLDRDRIEAAVSSLTGESEQVPPQFSAKKVEGEAMYHKARRGERVTLDPVAVRVDEIDLRSVQLPLVRFRIRCSSGTYVRAVARDLAARLGTCGRLDALRRTRVGRFRVSRALSLEGLADPERVEACRIDPAEAVSHLPLVQVDEEDARRLAHGQALEVRDGACPPEGGPAAAVMDGVLAAVVERSGTLLRPRKVFLRV